MDRDYPIMIGMPRSASRMTWQILRFLLPKDMPEDWYPELGSKLEDDDWPVRRHTYIPGHVPIVYTYRHPVEAYLSYFSRTTQDVGKKVPDSSGVIPDPTTGYYRINTDKDTWPVLTLEQAAKNCMLGIGAHWTLYNKLKDEHEAGRKILFMRYEDYYGDDEARTLAIATFIGLDPKLVPLPDILKYVDVKKNAKRGRAIADYLPDAVFATGFSKSGMQKGHINLDTMGKPGSYISQNPEFVTSVITGDQPALRALREMCIALDYSPWNLTPPNSGLV